MYEKLLSVKIAKATRNQIWHLNESHELTLQHNEVPLCQLIWSFPVFFNSFTFATEVNFKRSLSDYLVRLALLVLSYPLSELRSFGNSVN